MLTLLVLILLVVGFFKFTGFILRAAGKLLGGFLGILGWIFIGALAITVFGLALVVFPVILIIGIVALVIAALSL